MKFECLMIRISVLIITLSIILNTVLLTSNSSVNSTTNILFELINEWNLVPDSTGRLYMLHESEIVDEKPDFVAARDTVFILYTRLNSREGHVMRFGDINALKLSNFNNLNPTRIITHGWLNDKNSPLNVEIRDAYLQKGEFNVIVVDWSAGSTTLSYITCRNRVNGMGYLLAKFIEFLVTNGDMQLSNLVLIGHSLGAHISGIAGKSFTNSKLELIYGLDPAGPLFTLEIPYERLSSGDAIWVEVIHTSAATLGFADPIADADFYPNGGRSQPGCEFDLIGICAHGRSFAFFAESLNSKDGFNAFPCNFNETEKGLCTSKGTPAYMGYYTTKKFQKGVYFLTTRSTPPFIIP